ncbi:hypothetical protein [Mucilaginibacter sp.]
MILSFGTIWNVWNDPLALELWNDKSQKTAPANIIYFFVLIFG